MSYMTRRERQSLSQRSHICTLPKSFENALMDRSLRRHLIPDANNPCTLQFYKSEFRIQAEREHHFKNYPWVISPFSVFRTYWQWIICAMLLVFFILEPTHMAFVFGTHGSAGFPPWAHPLELFLDFFLLVDIFLNFHCGFLDSESNKVVLDKKIIAARYLRFFFWIDLLSTLPFFIILWQFRGVFEIEVTTYECIKARVVHIDCVADVLDFLKMLKFFRVPTLFQHGLDLTRRYQWSTFRFSLLKVVAKVAFVMHGTVLAHFTFTRILTDASHRLERSSIMEMYFFTVLDFWPVLGLFDFELPDFRHNESKVAISVYIIVTVVGFYLRTYFIAQLIVFGRILIASYTTTEMFSYEQSLKGIMRHNKVPSKDQKRLLNTFDYRFLRNVGTDRDLIMFDPVGKKFVEECIVSWEKRVLKKFVPILHLPEDIKRKIFPLIELHTFKAGDEVTNDNAGMHIVNSGTIVCYDQFDHVEVKRFEKGDRFGTLYLDVLDEDLHFRKWCKVDTDTFYLSQEGLMKALGKEEELYQRLRIMKETEELIEEILDSLFESRVVLHLSSSIT